jgi:hypothetical protein
MFYGGGWYSDLAVRPISEGAVMKLAISGVCVGLAIAVAMLAGESDDPKPIKIPGRQAAPEFEDVTAWVNSEPLTMKGLQGKVVVVHFMTFG